MLRRPEVFDDDHLPRQLLHRERETKQLLRALDPGPDGDSRGHAVISGPSGVGKTVLLRYCSRTLERERSIDSAYVRCLGSTSGTVLRETIGDLAGGPDEIAHAQPLEAVVDALHTAIDGTTIVVLDEADDVPDTAIETRTDIRGVSVCLICHEPDRWYSSASPAVRDRLRARTELHLDRYGVSELADILERHAQAGLAPGAVGRDHIERIADDVAGVARDGIQTLRYAANVATEAGRDRILGTDRGRPSEGRACDSRSEPPVAPVPVSVSVRSDPQRRRDLLGGDLRTLRRGRRPSVAGAEWNAAVATDDP